MTDTPNDGGPAFPHDPSTMYECDANKVHQGMSLRQWYAGMAMQGFAANGQIKVQLDEDGPFGNMAGWCFQLADAMLQHEQGADNE